MKKFASQNDLEEKKISFEEIGKDLFAFTAEGDPNSGIIIGEDSVMVIDAQATPTLARQVIEKVRSVTDKPISYLVLSHYHAVRVLGASQYKANNIVMSSKARSMVAERGQEDWDSEFDRFPRLFKGYQEIPGLTWPTITFENKMSLFLGKRRIDLYFLGRAHTAGDIIIHVPDSNVLFTGDIVEYKSACYCGDAHLQDWPKTLKNIAKFQATALVPGRGDALVDARGVEDALALTEDFVASTFKSVAKIAYAGGDLKEAILSCRDECDKKFADYAIYEHCLPFNVSRAFDEAKGIDNPRIWTAQRDKEMWKLLQ
ncbi:MAG: MBL fold metallo-hydrolase [Candidatus Endolissoclinum sp. TMED37]|nr:MAG: MBL fold metallo-hydrolase [Candidatus Endolissoclinum sp. TMED37]